MRSRWDLTPQARKEVIAEVIRMYEVEKKSINIIHKELRMSATTIRRLLRSVGYNVIRGNRPSTRAKYKCAWCGKEFWRVPSLMNKRPFCSHSCYSKWRVGKYAGENCGKWKGGITPLQIKQLQTKEWAALVRRMRSYYDRCFLCDSNEKLHVHHIVPRRMNEELMYDYDNLAILCASCHRKIKFKEDQYEQVLRDCKVSLFPTYGGRCADEANGPFNV